MRIVIFAFALTLLTTSTSNAQRIGQDIGLKGMKGITVEVAPLNDSDFEARSIAGSQIQTAVELKLRKAGIQVIDRKTDRPSYPQLYVLVSVFKRFAMYFVVIDYEVIDFVNLRRGDKPLTLATLWAHMRATTVGCDNIRDVRQDIEDGADTFINEYLKANPK